ncbi:MAG: hypothetical protein R3E79_16025 [Caldilineaceae bacterium]
MRTRASASATSWASRVVRFQHALVRCAPHLHHLQHSEIKIARRLLHDHAGAPCRLACAEPPHILAPQVDKAGHRLQ